MPNPVLIFDMTVLKLEYNESLPSITIHTLHNSENPCIATATYMLRTIEKTLIHMYSWSMHCFIRLETVISKRPRVPRP